MAFASSRIGAQEALIKPCDLCEDEENVDWFCKDCDQNLCDRCKRLHLRSNISKFHCVLSISEGFEMGKMNISNMCRDHDEPFLFLCRTCDKNICPTCLSMEHKVHDFVEMRKLHSEMQKPLDRVIKSKEDEMKKMTKNYEDLDQHANESETYLKERYAFIDERVQAIKLAADDEGQKLKKSLQEQIKQGDREVKICKNEIQFQTKVYEKEIETVKRELRLQTGSSLKCFVKESINKFESMRPISIEVPNTSQLFTEGHFDQTQIRDMIGKMSMMAKVEDKKIENEEAICETLSDLEMVSSFELKDIFRINCMCLSPDGSIWIGGRTLVTKMSPDCSTMLRTLKVPNTHANNPYSNLLQTYRDIFGFSTKSVKCIACLQSGGVIVGKGGRVYIFNSDGRRRELINLNPEDANQIFVTYDDRIVIDVDDDCIAIFTKEGRQLEKIKVDQGISTLCSDSNGNIIVAHPNASHLTLLDGRNGQIKTKWAVSTSGIMLLTCDRHGNILASNKRKHIYFFGKNGGVKETFTLDCDEIRGICVNQDDRLLVLVIQNYEAKILAMKYLK